MNLLDAQLAAGVLVNAAEFAREHGVSVRTVYTGIGTGSGPRGSGGSGDDSAGAWR